MGPKKSKMKYFQFDHTNPIEGYENLPIVSLESAIQPLKTVLPSIETYVYLAKEKCQNPADNLTQDQSASIMLCTMRWKPYEQCLSVQLNQLLQSKNRQKLEPWFLYLKLLFTALDRLPSINQIVYRGIKLDITDQYPIDHVIQWWDFALCTNSIDLLNSDKFLGRKGIRTTLTIESNTSKDITKHSFDPSYNAILILPSTKFKVLRCFKQTNNHFWIQLKEFQTKLTTLNDNSFNRLENSGALQLNVEQLSNHANEYEEMDLNGLKLTVAEALLISNNLYNNYKLKRLYLNDNFLNDRGVEIIARVLAQNNSNLQELHLARNNITNEGAKRLAEMLTTNKSLIKLSLYGNKIDDIGIRYLTHILAYYNTTLEHLYLSGNTLMTDRSVDLFIEMFQENQRLKVVQLYNCNLSQSGIDKLKNSIRKKHDLILHV